MKYIFDDFPLWSPVLPMTVNKYTSTMNHWNHIHESHELDDDGRPGNPCYAQTRKTKSVHQKWIQSDIYYGTDDKCSAIGLRVSVSIEYTIQCVGKEKNKCKGKNRYDVVKRKWLNQRCRITRQMQQSRCKGEKWWCQNNDEHNTQKDNMLDYCGYLFFILCSESIADQCRCGTRETISEDDQKEKNRKCLTHRCRRFDSDFSCPEGISDIEKCVKKETDSRREANFPEKRRNRILQEVWLRHSEKV